MDIFLFSYSDDFVTGRLGENIVLLAFVYYKNTKPPKIRKPSFVIASHSLLTHGFGWHVYRTVFIIIQSVFVPIA